MTLTIPSGPTSLHRLLGALTAAFLLPAVSSAQGGLQGTYARPTPPQISSAAPRLPMYATQVLGPCGVSNASWETGDFTGWVIVPNNFTTLPLQVAGAGAGTGFGFFTSAPTQGGFCVLNDFDSIGGNETIVVSQDVPLAPGTQTIDFDYRGAWDMLNFPGSTLPRTFYVDVEPAGGGPALATYPILTAAAGSVNLDTGPLTGSVDVSAFAGLNVRLSFEWFIPEALTGPGLFQLDNVRCASGPTTGTCGGINQGFETGDFTGWVTGDLLQPLNPIAVVPGGTPLFFWNTAPTEGSFAVAHGFDGDGPGLIFVAQDLALPPGAGTLEFDYRTQVDNFGTLPREFRVEIEPSGGGPALQSTLILSAPPGTLTPDTGYVTGTVDVSAFAGAAVRVSFEWTVPEFYTGPAAFELDNVRCGAGVPGTCGAIDESFESGVFTGWIATDLAIPYDTLRVAPASTPTFGGVGGWFTTPTDGAFSVFHGFDGGGPGTIEVEQDLILPPGTTEVVFDYRSDVFNGGLLPRDFLVDIEPSGGGPALQSVLVLSVPPGPGPVDTGYLTGSVNVAPFAGAPVRLSFKWIVPEFFTGPGAFELDNVRCLSTPIRSFCFGDGSGTACPCGNAGAPGHGCANGNFASGSLLFASGSSSVAADDLVLRAASSTPNQPGLFFQGNNAVNGGLGSPFGDGLRCAGGNVVRLQVVSADPTGNAQSSISIVTKGNVLPGTTRRYQWWYRDAQLTPCGTTFNLSNGLEVIWAP